MTRCEICNDPIEGKVARWCLTCFSKHSRRCPECSPLGRLISKYSLHAGPLPDVNKDGTAILRKCNRCGFAHSHEENRQLKCARCDNERVVFEPPEQQPPALADSGQLPEGQQRRTE